MDDINHDTLRFPPLDERLDQIHVFSRRTTNALVRHGIITLRLLLQYPPELLLQDIRNLGEKSLIEIEETLRHWHWRLPKTVDIRQVILNRLLVIAFHKTTHPLQLSALTYRVNRSSKSKAWKEEIVAKGAIGHPYIEEIEGGRYQFKLQSLNIPVYIPQQTKSGTQSQPSWRTSQGQIMLSDLWANWLLVLSQREQEVLFYRYGIRDGKQWTLKEIGQQFDLSRERVRQITKKGLEKLGDKKQKLYWQPLQELLVEGVQLNDGLLTFIQWEQVLNKHTIWETDKAQPLLLPLLSTLFKGYHHLDNYQVVTFANINVEHISKLESALKKALSQNKETGLIVDDLLIATQKHLHKYILPDIVFSRNFILRSVTLFQQIEYKDDKHYYLRKKERLLNPIDLPSWVGQPGTKLYEWEQKLRLQFKKVVWIGQITLSEETFKSLCQIIQKEAQEPNYFTKVVEGQPRLVPAAVFITTMVFTARYAEQEAGEFWIPYLHMVWNQEYTQAFMARCRKRFKKVIPYLEQTFGFEFPQESTGDLVRPIYRHALLPRYMQSDLALWLSSKWYHILDTDSPELLVADLRQDRSLERLSLHLQKFILDKATQDTAAALITNMAAAISLHVNDGESIESISYLLADTPIEQEIWREITQSFVQKTENISTYIRSPRLTWVWSLDEAELTLRLQNLILPANNNLAGEPDRLVWLEIAESDPLEAEIEVEVTPWYMTTGERIINNVFIPEPDGPLGGQLVLLTDMDEIVLRMDIPSYPKDNIQFFRATQQGAYGIPVQPVQVGNGIWYVCAKQAITIVNEKNEAIEPDTVLTVPYPIGKDYQWAAQFSLNIPATVIRGKEKQIKLAGSSNKLTTGRPFLSGKQPIVGLSRQVQPTFADTQISLTVYGNGEKLLKQASLWILGQDGWRWQRPLAEMHEKAHIKVTPNGLLFDLSQILPSRPNLYTIELRTSLKPLLSAPLQLAIVPELIVEPPPNNQLYTPNNLPRLILSGVDETVIVERKDTNIKVLPDGRLQIVWVDLRQEPQLTLRFAKVDIPLAWSVPRFMIWVDPKPTRPFLTLDEMKQTVLHAVKSQTAIDNFTLFIPGQQGRTFPLKRNKYTTLIGQSQLYDMVHLASKQHTTVKAQIKTNSWTLFEVRRRPNLFLAEMAYDIEEQIILFSSGLKEAWQGNCRFTVESLTNPFAPVIELGQTHQLKDLHLLPATLSDGVYLLYLELDGARLPLNETAMRFTVGQASNKLIQARQLGQEIRNGSLITSHLTEDFVLLWAEIAEVGRTKLTPTTLYQLATVPAQALENFATNHLQTLWSPLIGLKTAHEQQWQEQPNYLPAWVLLPNPLILKTVTHGFQLRVYPIQVMLGGKYGVGYGRWRTSPKEGASKEFVFVQWQPATELLVQVEAGLPETIPQDWTMVDLLDTFGLYYCPRCGRLTGVKEPVLPDEIAQAHRHGRNVADLRNITWPEEHGGYKLLAEPIPERRGSHLLDIFDEYNVILPLASSYLTEPIIDTSTSWQKPEINRRLLALLREVKRYGNNNKPTSFWASATRLLNAWYQTEEVTLFGQTVMALGILLRSAAYYPRNFHRLRKNANLSELDIQNLLTWLNETAVAHIQWALTWAEMLKVHSLV